jgi:hypothetical protein
VTAPVTVKGTNLVATDIILHAFDKTFPLTSVDADGMTGHASVAIPGDWNFEKDASVYLENKKTGQITLAVSLVSPVAPLLTSVDFFSDAEKGKAAAAAGNSISVKLKVVGQRLVADDTELVFPNAGEPLLGSVAEDRKSAEATVILPSKYDPKSTCSVALKSKRTGLLSQSATLKAAK